MLKRNFLVTCLLVGAASGALAAPPVPYATLFTPGTPAELPYMMKVAGAQAANGVRKATSGQFWVYGFPVVAGSRCRLSLVLDEPASAPLPNIAVVGLNDKPLPVRIERDPDGAISILWTVPDKWTLGTRIPVRISARGGSVTVKLARFVQQEPDMNGDGLPDSVLALMTQGLAPTVRPTVFPTSKQPYTITQTGRTPEPLLDLQTDAVFAYTSDAAAIAGWKARGYTVWTMGGSRDQTEYAKKHPDELQTTADGNPIAIETSYYFSPTANRIAIENAFYSTALANGSDGVCPEEPEYWARAGYEGAFKAAWQTQYKMPWQDPASSVEARWKAGQLMAALETDHIASILQNAAQKKPGTRRLAALHSPLNYALWNIVSPQYRITSLPSVQEVIGQVWTGTARTPARYAGVRSDRAFSVAYLEYSSLYQLLRGTGKRLWFLVDPLEDTPNLPLADYKQHYEETLIPALLFPEVDAFEVMPWPERVYGHIPAEYATQVNSVIAAMQDMHQQQGTRGNIVTSADIGVFVSDSMQWQRERPTPSDFDGVFGLTLPLLQRGIPVQLVSLDRADDPNYLKPFKTLLLSYDFQKPPNARVQAALADWVRKGGSLIFFGGSDPYNGIGDSWWRRANLPAPQEDLWNQLGVRVGRAAVTRYAPPEDKSRYQVVLQGDGAEHDLKNRRVYSIDLSRFVKETGSVTVRFGDRTPQDGWGAYVAGVELRVNGQLAAAFQTGTEIESRFLAYDNNSQFSGGARFADRTGSWTYRFDSLPRNATVTLSVDMGNGFEVSAAAIQPDFGHALLGAKENDALVKAFPRLRINADYPVTLYPDVSDESKGPREEIKGASQERDASLSPRPSSLYSLRAGGVPIWSQTVGKGLALNVGIAPGFFSASEISAGLLRGIVQYAHQQAGGTYREAGYLRLQRGRYTVVKTFASPTTVEGRTIDLLTPTLPVAVNRVIPPRSLALLYDMGADKGDPRLGFVSGRVQAQLETPTTTTFFVRGPLNTNGAARLHAGGKRLTGVRASDRLGRPVAIQSTVEGSTVLLRYPNHPDGVIVRAAW